MATVGQKIRTLVLSNLHELLDKTIDLNSTGAIKQHIRDLETARDKITDEAAIAKGRVLTLQAEIRDLDVQISTTNENIELFIKDGDPSNDHLAETLEARLIGYEKKLADKKEALSAEMTTSSALEDASGRLRAKHAEMVEALRKLESIERTTQTLGWIDFTHAKARFLHDLDLVIPELSDDGRFELLPEDRLHDLIRLTNVAMAPSFGPYVTRAGRTYPRRPDGHNPVR